MRRPDAFAKVITARTAGVRATESEPTMSCAGQMVRSETAPPRPRIAQPFHDQPPSLSSQSPQTADKIAVCTETLASRARSAHGPIPRDRRTATKAKKSKSPRP